ncbi:hypothetical protein AVEN_178550-1 [Araneus ventricosus]|uniref:Uncharacterized protein n=1 Tax=Araneus ventricosus TaxID=182803 RepID=A0A4Y2HHU3_ARAVE|nr:hypothetical protein AVEN_178550-1 [Araneus ventricosus]
MKLIPILVIHRFEAIRGLFWDGPSNCGQMTRTQPELAPAPLRTSAPHLREDVCLPTYDLPCNGPAYAADLQWNRVSSLEPSSPEGEGHRGLK